MYLSQAQSHARIHPQGWRPLPLALTLLAVGALLWSWLGYEPTRAVWDALDHGIFAALNGTLGKDPAWDMLWALANNRSFDLIPAFIFIWLFLRHIYRGGQELFAQRFCACAFAALYTLFVVQLERALFDFPRSSPSLVVESANRLTLLVPWLATKDSSMGSFPGDHGTVAIMFATFLWYFNGWRFAFWGAALVLLSILPRMVGGAHWFTDIAIGSATIAATGMAAALATPLFRVSVGVMAATLQRRMPGAETLLRNLLLDKEQPTLVLKGICMGTADIIPGISGGTVAYILGIYQRLLAAITMFNRDWFRKLLCLRIRDALAGIPASFLLPLAVGIAAAVFIFTKMIPLPYLLVRYPEPMYGLFFGLIAGSSGLLLRRYARARARDWSLIALGITLGYLIVTLVPAETPDASWFIFLCGMMAISAMLLPGISGSFILLILGKYAMILQAVGDLNLLVILPFAAGCAVGLLGFSHILSWLLKHYGLVTNLLLTGMLIGTLRAVWPFQERLYATVGGKERLLATIPHWPSADMLLGLTGAMMAAGFALVFILQYLGRRKGAAAHIH